LPYIYKRRGGGGLAAPDRPGPEAGAEPASQPPATILYIYIYIERERDVYIYIYIYIIDTLHF